MITYRVETVLGPLRVLTDGIFRSGPPVLLLHGWTLSPWTWVALMPPTIRVRRRWYALSLPGHLPDTAALNLPLFTTERLAEALAQAIDALTGDEPVHLVGHSLGGFWALCLAVYQPRRLERLALLSSFADGSQVSMLQQSQRLAAHATGRQLFRIGYRWMTARPGRWRRLLARMSGQPEVWQKTAGQVYFDSAYVDAKRYHPDVLLTLAAATFRMDLTEELEHLQHPVLLVAGVKDPVVPIDHVRTVAERLSQVRLEMLPNVGHFPMVEAPDAVAEWVERFLSVEKLSEAKA